MAQVPPPTTFLRHVAHLIVNPTLVRVACETTSQVDGANPQRATDFWSEVQGHSPQERPFDPECRVVGGRASDSINSPMNQRTQSTEPS
jgi:hypothetical protein